MQDAPSSQPSPSAGSLPHSGHSLDTLETKANICCKDVLLLLLLGLVATTKHSKMLQVSCMTESCLKEGDCQVHLNLLHDREPGQSGKKHFCSLSFQASSSLRDMSAYNKKAIFSINALSYLCICFASTGRQLLMLCDYTLSNIWDQMLRVQPAGLHQAPGANTDALLSLEIFVPHHVLVYLKVNMI